MRDYIPIDTELIPYKYSIELAGNVYTLEFKYNSEGEFYTVGLYGADGEIFCADEPIVYGVPLFKDTYRSGFPALTIIPSDEAGNSNTVTSENLGKTVFLNIFDDEVDEVLYSGQKQTLKDFQRPKLNFVMVFTSGLAEIEGAIKEKGGTVNKKKDIPATDELRDGVLSIKTGEKAKMCDVYYGKVLETIKG